MARSVLGSSRASWNVRRTRALARIVMAAALAASTGLVIVRGVSTGTASAATDQVGTCDASTLRSVISAAAAGDTVTFGCSGTIDLTSDGGGTIVLSKDLTIDGSGQAVTISGGGSVQVFSVSGGVSLTLNRLTVANGRGICQGGGILNNGTVSVTDSTFSGNTDVGCGTGGGILNNGGTVSVIDSTFSGNSANGAIGSAGGAIDNNGGMVSVTNSTFSGNSCGCFRGSGGAIDNRDGTLNVTNSTFSGNSAEGSNGAGGHGSGGGIASFGTATLSVSNSTFSGSIGGAIAASGTVIVSNSTFSGNSAITTFGGGSTGGGIGNGGTLSVSNSTFSGNSDNTGRGGGGIVNGGTLNVTNSTFSGNSASAPGGIANFGTATLANTILAGSAGGNCGGSITDNGGNLADDNTCGFTQPSSRNSASGLNLGPLADNGGPTQTIALLPGSVAIDFTSCLQATDQRGSPRPDAGETRCDSGAYEFQDTAAGLVNDLIGLVDSFGLPHGMQTSLEAKLRDALAAVNAGDTATACGDLTAFGNEVRAQAGKKLTLDQANQLLAAASNVMKVLGC